MRFQLKASGVIDWIDKKNKEAAGNGKRLDWPSPGGKPLPPFPDSSFIILSFQP